MQLKRKGLEEEAIAAADGILPSKKLKQELQFPQEEAPCPIIPEESPIITEVWPVEVQFSDAAPDEPSPALFITEPDSDERALVLYQPRSPSQTTLPVHYKGFQVNSDAVNWFSPSKSFRHRSSFFGDSNNNLAVVPYVAPYNARPGADSNGGRVIIEEITEEEDEAQDPQGNNSDSMMVEDWAAPMEADEAPEPMDTSMDSTPAVPPSTCEIPYWQRFNPHYNSPVMWS